jgi:type IV pilus assembly protein PilN
MIRINLLPYREKEKKENLARQIIIISVSFVLFLLLLFSIQTYISFKIRVLAEDVKTNEEKLVLLTKKVGDVERVKKIKADLERKIGIIKTLEENRLDPVKMMDELSRLTPAQNIWLEKWSQSGDKLQIEGVARNSMSVAQFMKNLERSAYLQTVDLVYTKQVEVAEVKVQQFIISCKMKKKGV